MQIKITIRCLVDCSLTVISQEHQNFKPKPRLFSNNDFQAFGIDVFNPTIQNVFLYAFMSLSKILGERTIDVLEKEKTMQQKIKFTYIFP